VGAIASGRVGLASHSVGVGPSYGLYLVAIRGAFPLATGLFALALFAFLAAVYLAYAATPDLKEDFRRRALVAAGVVFVMAAVSVAASYMESARLATGITRTPIGVFIQLTTGTSAVTAIWALWRRNYALARIAAAAQTISIIWGWALAQFPWIIPEELRIRDAAAPTETLVLLIVGLAVGAAILIPALRYLFRLFARPAA
jgi:cytochrome d ubiquinol oxidase subunit II